MARKLENGLNDLNGAQWLYFTDTIYQTSYPADATHALRKAHGAMKPPEVMAELIRFFSREGELVLDPMAGVGGTLLGAALSGRKALGIELNPRWVEVYREIQRDFLAEEGRLLPRREAAAGRPLEGEMRQGSCLDLLPGLPAGSVDAVITDPPYGCQHGATGFKAETNFNMFNPEEAKDFANAPDFAAYLDLMRRLGEEAWRVLKQGRYLVLMVGDRYKNGEYLPLGWLVAEEMRRVGFKFKGLRLWSNRATQRPLKPYAVLQSFVPNITHQNILVLRKEFPPEKKKRPAVGGEERDYGNSGTGKID